MRIGREEGDKEKIGGKEGEIRQEEERKER